MGDVTTITHLRGIPALRGLRGRHPAVVVCLDDPAAFEACAAELEALESRCEECPQSGVDMHQAAGDWG